MGGGGEGYQRYYIFCVIGESISRGEPCPPYGRTLFSRMVILHLLVGLDLDPQVLATLPHLWANIFSR